MNVLCDDDNRDSVVRRSNREVAFCQTQRLPTNKERETHPSVLLLQSLNEPVLRWNPGLAALKEIKPIIFFRRFLFYHFVVVVPSPAQCASVTTTLALHCCARYNPCSSAADECTVVY